MAAAFREILDPNAQNKNGSDIDPFDIPEFCRKTGSSSDQNTWIWLCPYSQLWQMEMFLKVDPRKFTGPYYSKGSILLVPFLLT